LRSYRNPSLTWIAETIRRVSNADFSDEEKNAFRRLEEYRTELNRDTRVISYEIFGSPHSRTISDICHKAACPQKWCFFLYVLADTLQSGSCLEIGTNLGISGSYLLSALQRRNGKLITMEGHPDLCTIAGDQFSRIAPRKSFEIIEGMYETTFPLLLHRPVKFDTIFIDGNHKKIPTLYYFQALKDKITNPAIFIFDDIHWSDEMSDTWSVIRNDVDVTYSVDLKKFGIVVIDKTDNNRNVHFEIFIIFKLS
jgi:predicted O-methyltransferase YrrM